MGIILSLKQLTKVGRIYFNKFSLILSADRYSLNLILAFHYRLIVFVVLVKKLIAIPSIWIKEIPYKHNALNLHNQPPFAISLNLTTAKEFLDFMQNSTFSEKQSDQCLVEEVAVVNHTKPHECPISENCKKYLLSQFDSTYQAYGATHR